MVTLKQNRLLNKREITITDSKITYRDIKIGKRDIEVDIPFEELAGHKNYFKINNYTYLLLSVLMFVASLGSLTDSKFKSPNPNLWIFFLLSSAILLFLHWQIGTENSWKIKFSNANLLIYKKSPDKETVDKFIDDIFSARNKYLRETYLTFDKNLSYEEQYKNLKWLKYVEVLSKDEFDQRYEQLKDLYQLDKKAEIGFSR